ncbi:MAG: histidinol-phosphate transaminase [Nitrospiraceae bacterium]|nr:MAG: histidinol-phosphate transaminase [Nitrospiraceae bacterium]
MDIKKLVKPNVRALKAYRAEEIRCKVKLDANESPYGFRVLKNVRTSKYPDPEAKELRRLFAKSLKVRTENVLHGNGSDELIYNIITTFGGPVLYPTPTFTMYGIISQALGEKHAGLSLDDSFDLDMDGMNRQVQRVKPKLIFLSSPNNPTGNSLSSDRMLKVIKKTKGIVVVDEAYQQFSRKKSFVPLLKKYKNLIVLRTLSKVGLAGIRTGFMVAHKEIVDEVNKVRLPFNVNALSQKVAIDALKKNRQLISHINSIISERKRLFKTMANMDRVLPFPSDANFILFYVKNADKIYRGLLKRGVLVRNLRDIAGGCLRVTVGTPAENNTFIKNLRQLL